jgi:hypothetical protein
MGVEKLRTLLRRKLGCIRKDLWLGGAHGADCEYRHQIATERAWAAYLVSIGCKLVEEHAIRRDFESAFNDVAPGTMCVKVESDFVFIPGELAAKILVLGVLP